MKLFSLLSVLSGIILLAAASVAAGTFSSDFEQYLIDYQDEKMVGAIITMADQVDLGALKAELYARNADRREWHEAVVLALQEKATVTQAGILAQLEDLSHQGMVKDYRGLWVGNVVLVTATPEALDILVNREDVLQVNPDHSIESIKPVEVEDDEPLISGVEIGLERIRTDEVWAMGYTGEGRLVSHLDTGVDGNHPALSSRWRGLDPRYADNPEWAWFDPVTYTQFPFDAAFHGTHTMGTITGMSETTGDTIGVAFGAQWMSAGVIDRVSVPQTVADALLSFEWVTDPDGDPFTVWDVPDVCSNSWGLHTSHGYPPCDQTFWVVLDGCDAAGVVVVFSAGNEGPGANSLGRPADRAATDLSTFSVGAVYGANPNLPIASFSSRGPSYCTPEGDPAFKPEVVAPGVNVRSSIPGPGGYGTLSGTSMACPHVAGVVALIRQANPNLTSDQVRQIILDTASDLGDQGEDNTYGMGVVDAYEAVIQALAYLEGWGALAGQITDQATGLPIHGATISVTDRPWFSISGTHGQYCMFIPADTLYDIHVEYPPTHLPIFDQREVAESETTYVDYALEGKVTVTLTASFANPDDVDYRSFYLKGSWDNNGCYDPFWSGDLMEINDDGAAPDETAGDGVFTGEVMLARDVTNTYSWAIYTENYGGENARIDDGADFDIPELHPPIVPTLEVNPSGSDNNWIFSVEGDHGLSLDLLPGVDSNPNKWGASDSLYEGITYTFLFHTMHSDVVTYGSGGAGGPALTFTPDADDIYDFIFNDYNDSYIVQLAGTEGPPTYLSAQGNLDGHIPVAWLEPGSAASLEMAYDDGIQQNAVAYESSEILFATMFVPESYPVLIDSVMVHVITEGDLSWPWPDWNHDPVGILIYLDDGTGYPQPDPVFYADAIAELGEWIRIDVDEITVDRGVFWVAWYNIRDNFRLDGLGHDADLDYPANRWVYDPYQGSWYVYGGGGGDLMIRSKVFSDNYGTWLGYDGAVPASEISPAVGLAEIPNLITTGIAGKTPPANQMAQPIDRMAYHPHILSEPGLVTETRSFDIAGYNLYRSTSPAPFDYGLKINADLILQTTYDDWGDDPYGPIESDITYHYQTSAVYDIGGGNFVEVGPSNEAAGTAQNHPPEAPQNLAGEVNDHLVSLTWNANTDYDIASYNIYYFDYNRLRLVPLGNVAHPITSFEETITEAGVYSFKLRAVDTGGLESETFSNCVDMPVGAIRPGMLLASDDEEFQVSLNWRSRGGNLQMDVENLDVGILIAETYFCCNLADDSLLAHSNGQINSASVINLVENEPTLEDLEAFDVIVTWSNYPYLSRTGLGDILADFIDESGKGVVALELAFYNGHLGDNFDYSIGGRFMREYSPFSIATSYASPASLVEQQTGHPLMEGVDLLQDVYVYDVGLQNNAEVVAWWDNGRPAVAYNASSHNPQVVCINAYPGIRNWPHYPSHWYNGEMYRLIVNSVLFVSGNPCFQPDSFRVYRADNESGPFELLAQLPSDQNDYVDYPIANGVPYWYQIKALWDSEESDPSNTIMTMAVNYPPEPPENLEAVADDYDINLTWTFADLMGDLDHFNIYRKLMPDGEWSLVGTSQTENYIDVIEEGEDGTYGYQVTAVDNGTPQLESNPFNTAYAPVGNLPPGGLVALSGEEFAVPLCWMFPGALSDSPGGYCGASQIIKSNSSAYTDSKKPDSGEDLGLFSKGVPEPYDSPVITDEGGPDEFGYTWIDSDEPGGPVYEWRDITDIGQQIEFSYDNPNQGPFDLGFHFPFYGEIHSAFNICYNGFLSFTSTSTPEDNEPLPSFDAPENLVAPFWDYLGPHGDFWYYSDGSECIVSFIRVWAGVGGYRTFQVIFQSDGTIIFQYEEMNDDLNRCTVGIQNSDRTIGLQVYYDYHYHIYLHDYMAIRIRTGLGGIPPVHYNLYRSETSPVPIDPAHLITGDIPGDRTSYVDTDNLLNGTTYYYVMTAVWPDSAESAGSNEIDAIPENYPPEPPENLEAIADHYDVDLTWTFTDLIGDLDHFNIYRKLTFEPDWVFIGTSVTTSYTDNIAPGNDGIYLYSVTAVDNGTPQLESDQCHTASVAVGNLPPLNLATISHQESVVPLRWDAPLPPCTTLIWDDGILTDGFYCTLSDIIMANHFVATAPVEICTLWVRILTEGDPRWPWPDANHDPVEITIWEGDGTGFPGNMLHSEIAACEYGEWITIVLDPPVICYDDEFWVGMNNTTNGGPYDALGLDEVTDFPQHKWWRLYGEWSTSGDAYYRGDHMIRVSVVSVGQTVLLTENSPVSDQTESSLNSSKIETAGPGDSFSPLSVTSVWNSDTPALPRLLDTEVMLGYNVYRNTSPNVPVDDDHRINTDYVMDTQYDDEDVENGTEYFYVVATVYDNDGDIEVSPPSNEESATPRVAGHLAADPMEIDIIGMAGQEIHVPLTLSNDGGLPVSFNIETTTAQGGRDEFYWWIDSDEQNGPEFEWIDITPYGTPINMSDNNNQGPFQMEFDFPFYGQLFSSFRFCDNGWISFTSTMNSHMNRPLPNLDAPENLLAPYWDSIIQGIAYYFTSAESTIVSWTDVYHSSGLGGPYTFQVILTANGIITFQYEFMHFSDNYSATVGIQDASKTIGLQIAHNQDYVHDQLAVRISPWWLNPEPCAGIVDAGGEFEVDMVLDASLLEDGVYESMIVISGCDENYNLPDINIPVAFRVDPTGIEEPAFSLPKEFALEQSYPNPFNARTEIKYALPVDSDVELDIYNVLGQKVETLVDENQPAGYHRVAWNAKDKSSGMYFYKIRAGDYVETKKMLLLK